MKRLLLIALVLVIAALPLLAERLEFRSTDLAGNPVDSTIFKDSRLTMVNIWGTFCPPCIQEMPDLSKLNRDIEGFQVVGFVIDALGRNGKPNQRIMNDARAIIMKTGAAYTHILPSKELMAGLFRDVQAVPTSYFVDSEGNIVGVYLGSRDYRAWKEIIDSYL
ncbi:MAG: TlpA family protein disulfide reductase [Spirochaetales bacterium]|nr:TlpA family protein disulfide reductase [Spirochaetales bacterium]